MDLSSVYESVNSDQTSASDGTPVAKRSLSLVAQFDDMCRFANSMVNIEEQSLIDLMTKCEENRVQWLKTQQELIEMKNKCIQLETEKQELMSKLKKKSFGFESEVQNRKDLEKERNELKKQLDAIKEFVLKEPSNGSVGTRDRVLSYLNLDQLKDQLDDEWD